MDSVIGDVRYALRIDCRFEKVLRDRDRMGIRMALGAPAGAVRSLIVRDGGRLAAIGIGLGFVVAFAATKADPLQAVRD